MSKKLYVLTTRQNDADILPFVIQYWKKYATKVIVYDMDSTDYSKTLLAEQDFIEVINKKPKAKDYMKEADYILECDIDQVIANQKKPISLTDVYDIEEYEMHGEFPKRYTNENFLQDYNFHYYPCKKTNAKIHSVSPKNDKKGTITLLNMHYLRTQYRDPEKTRQIIHELADAMYDGDVFVPYKQNIEQKMFKTLQLKDTKLRNITNKNKKCVIIVPVYKNQLNKAEEKSLQQLVKVVKNSFQIVLIYPEGLYYEYYRNICGYEFGFAELNHSFFDSIWNYNILCQMKNFYEIFKDYEYMLLYQLDGWIFYNNILKFCNLGYDYIGSPWRTNIVGNGGVSLRKVDAFIDVCSQITPSNRKYEDILFSIDYKNMLNIATIEVAANFSLCEDPGYFWSLLEKKTPMCVHSYTKLFWKDKIK